MPSTTKRRARRAAAYAVACCALLALPISSCSDSGITGPTDRLTPTTASFSASLALNSRIVYLGAPNSEPVNFIRARVYDGAGATLGSVDQNLDPAKNAFDFALNVALPGARATNTRMTLELANRAGTAEIVQYSGRVLALPLAPGDFRQVNIDLYPGPLDNFDVRAVQIAKPLHDILEDDSLTATATVLGGGPNTRIIWSSLDAATAIVGGTGKILGKASGSARIVAAVGPVADTAVINVLARRDRVVVTPPTLELPKVGDVGTFTATVVDRRGNAIPTERVTWSIANAQVGTIVTGGTIQGIRAGETTVSARSVSDPSLSGTAVFRVRAADPRVARIDITPADATLRTIGATQAYVATARDGAGNVLPNVQLVWSSSTPAIAAVNASGVATAVSSGSTTISATADTVSGSATLRIVPAATRLLLVAGDNQRDTVAKQTSAPVSVRTVDANGAPVAATTVRFAADGDGSSISPATVVTGNDGIAQARISLGTVARSYRFTASADSLAGSPVAFSATATPGAPASLFINRAPSSPVQSRIPFATQPEIGVMDAHGNAVVRGGLTITAANANGLAFGANAATDATSGHAIYTALSIGGTVGDRTLTFSSPGLRSISTHVTLTAGAPASVTAVNSATQTAQVGTSVPVAPSVRVVDADGNPVAGVTVVFAVTAGNGSLVNASVTTDANGVATVGSWTLGSTPGANTVVASVGTLNSAFNATATPMPGAEYVVTPAATSVVVGTGVTVTAQLADANHNPVSTPGRIITWSSTNGGSFSSGTSTTNASGQATVTFTASTTAGVTHVATATDGSSITGTTAGITTIAGAPSAVTSTITVGSTALAVNGMTTITVIVRDAYGNVVANATPASITLSSSAGSIGTVSCVNGTCTATFTAPATSGTANITATIGGTAVSNPPVIAVSGVPGVATGLTATRGNAQVALSWTAPVTNGSAITNYVIEYKPTSGSSWSTFVHAASTATSIIVTGLTNGTSYDFRVSAVNGNGTGVASSIATATPATTAGAPTGLSATIGSGQAALTWSVPANDGGSPVTDYVVEYSTDGVNWTPFAHAASAGTSLTVTGLTNGTAYQFRISAVNALGTSAPSGIANGTPTAGGTPHLSVSGGNNQTAAAGSAVATAPSVTAIDASNNPVPGVSVTFAVTSGNGQVTGATAATNALGVATLGSWTLGTVVGANTLSASAIGYTAATVGATGVTGAASAVTSTIVANPTSLAANGTATSSLSVQLKDANGNNLTSGGATVTFAAPSSGGIGSVTDRGDGTYTATYTAGTSPSVVAIQPKLNGTNFTNTASITLGVGAASQLAIATQAANAASGAAFTTQPVVAIRDANGNLVPSSANVTMTVSAGGTVVGTATIAAVNGTATFTNAGISGLVSGSPYTLTFASSGLTSATQSIALGAGAPAQLAVITSAAGATNGAAFGTQPVIEIQDAAGNRTTSTATVTMSVSSGATTVGTVAVAAVNGRASFTTAGISGAVGTSYTLTFSGSSLTSTTQAITPSVGAATQLALTTNASGAASGAAFVTQPVVAIRDPNANTVSSSATVTMTVSTGGTIVGTASVVASNGVATFTNVGISGSTSTNNPYTLTFASSGLASATQSITLTAGAPAQLAIITSAAGAANGSAFSTQPVIEIRDAEGNRTASTANVTVGVSAGASTVGTVTIAAVNGRATFGTAGISGSSGTSYTLTYSSAGVSSTTQSITAASGTDSQLALTTSAAGAASGAAFTTQPVVEIRDALGVRTSSTANVTMTVSAGGTVVGTSTVAAVNGTATFTNAGISGTAGTSYTLTFASPSLSSATQSITPVAGAPSASTTTLAIGSTAVSVAGTTTITVTVKDAFGNVVTAATPSDVTLATDAGSIGTVSCTNGVCTATFTAPGSAATATITAKLGGTNVSSSPAAITVASAPGAPISLAATSNADSQVPLAWNAPASNGGSAITNYLVEYSANGGGTWSTFAHSASTATSITVTGLTNGTTYTFRVSAINAIGTSTASSTATATPVGAPGAPTNLSATPASGQAALTWTAPSNNGGSAITDYVIEYSSSGGTSWSTFSHTASTATSITVTGLTNGTVYTFRVSARNASGTGATSSTTTATPGAPGAPTNLGVSLNQVSGTSHTASVTWTAPASNGGSAVTDYLIQYKQASTSTWTTFAHTASTTTSASIAGLSNSTTYDFHVAAINAVGTGPFSSTVSATTTGPSQRLQCQTNGNSNSNSTTVSVTPCSSLQVGDIIVIPVGITNSGTAKTITSADGFTALSSVQNTQDLQNQFQTTVFYKIATAADVGRSAAYSFSWSGTEKSVITLVAYKNVDGSAPAMASATGQSASATAPSGPNMSVASHTLLYFYLQNIALSSTTPSISEWGFTTGSTASSDLFKNTTAGANNANAIGIITADIDKFAAGQTTTTEKAVVTGNSSTKAWTAIVLGIHP